MRTQTHYFHKDAVANGNGIPFSVDEAKKLRVSFVNSADVSASKITFKVMNESGTLEAIKGTSIADVASTPVLLSAAAGTFIFDVAGMQSIYMVLSELAGKTAGTSVSGSSPSTDISAGSNTKFKISVDNDTAETVTITLTGLDTGAKIATALQTAIRALGGNKAAVTVVFTTVYTITSGTQSAQSSVVITNGTTLNLAAALKIGVANGGTEAIGKTASVSVCAFNKVVCS